MAMAAQAEGHAAFFYGTLMHPKILKWVIENDATHLQICAAVLLDHTRHIVIGAEYPGVLPYNRSQKIFTRLLTQEERMVRGTLVKGLTIADMNRLDDFEGDQYIRRKVEVHPLGPFVGISTLGTVYESVIPADPPPIQKISELSDAAVAETYIYADEFNLEAELWSYEEFIKVGARKWYGEEKQGEQETVEVVNIDWDQTQIDIEMNPWR